MSKIKLHHSILNTPARNARMTHLLKKFNSGSQVLTQERFSSFQKTWDCPTSTCHCYLCTLHSCFWKSSHAVHYRGLDRVISENLNLTRYDILNVIKENDEQQGAQIRTLRDPGRNTMFGGTMVSNFNPEVTIS
ncbi:hypothetical protein M8J77_005254 [Diaphorina citri]|nr:hypothetical protein M8J77_005254 [Diaphorina citri]